MKEHKERAHALLSASGADRWLKCTPSARLEDQYPEVTSEYAEEGTLAHELAELKLVSARNLILKRKETQEETKDRRAKYASITAHKYYSKEMEQYTSDYVDYVISEYQSALKTDSAAMLLIEERLDFSSLVPGGFGTGDAVIIANGILKVIDLKYGKGKKVDANDNPQLKLYGFGAVCSVGDLYEFDALELTIYQPRMDNISTYPTTVADLVAWAEDVVRPKAKQADKGKGELVTGLHCGFCKHLAKCSAYRDEAISHFDDKPSDVHTASDEELIRVYGMAKMLSAYLDAVEAHIRQTALEGKKWPGLKLVEGRSVRVIGDVNEAERILLEQGFKVEDLYNAKLKGLGDLEKLVGGKKVFEELLGAVITKPPGAPTLAPESDKRQEINVLEAVKNLFNDEI